MLHFIFQEILAINKWRLKFTADSLYFRILLHSIIIYASNKFNYEIYKYCIIYIILRFQASSPVVQNQKIKLKGIFHDNFP